MCKCNPDVRTPYCGKGDCVWPEKIDTENRLDMYELDDFMEQISRHISPFSLESHNPKYELLYDLLFAWLSELKSLRLKNSIYEVKIHWQNQEIKKLKNYIKEKIKKGV